MSSVKIDQRVLPGEIAPALTVKLVGGGQWDLRDSNPPAFTAVVFYRGRFCSVCSRYLPSIQSHAADFASRGTDVILISADDEGQAQAAKDDWGLSDVRVGYGLAPVDMVSWGLFMSAADPGRPMAPVFCEPGLFLIKPDKTLFYIAVNSAPFGRPPISEMLQALDFIAQREGGYPRRGGFRLARAAQGF